MADLLKILLTFFVWFTIMPCDAQICNFRGKPVAEQDSPVGIFDITSTIEYNGSILRIDGDPMVIDDVSTATFTDQHHMQSQLQCNFYPATDFRESISGEITTFALDAGQNTNGISKLAHIRFTDYGRNFTYVLVNGQYLYEFVNAEAYNLDLVSIYETSETTQIDIEYVPQNQISGSLEVVTEAIVEVVTEQQLLREGYDSISVTPAILGSDYNLLLSESSDCPDAITEQVPTTVKVKDAYTVLVPVPAVLGTYNTLILDTWAYEGQGYYERSPIDLSNAEIIYTTGITLTALIDGCNDANFLPCTTHQLQKDTTIVTSTIGTVYPACKEGYLSAGIYCLTETMEVPNTYKTYYYERLDLPATTEVIEVPAEYITTSLPRITNKEDLDEGCITSSYDSVAYEKLIVPATAERHPISPLYTTTTSQRIISGPEIDAVTSVEITDTLSVDSASEIIAEDITVRKLNIDAACMHEAIRMALIAEGLLSDTQDAKSIAYYQAIIDYQLANDLPIGVLDQQLLQSLNISI